MIRSLSWDDVASAAALVRRSNDETRYVLGVPRGGSVVVPHVCAADDSICRPYPCTGDPVVDLEIVSADPRVTLSEILVVDDIAATGSTLSAYRRVGFRTDALFRREGAALRDVAPSATVVGPDWLLFPWERPGEDRPESHVARILEFLGEDPSRDGLRDTPARVVRSLREMTSGLHEDPAAVLTTTFDQEADELVLVSGIRFSSLCEHHLLPFWGEAHVGYLPGEGRVVGLSKIPRLVDVLARRPQIQERLTRDVARYVARVPGCRGVGVLVRAVHSCLACRGARQPDARMSTSALLGLVRDQPDLRAEFLTLVSSRD